MAKIVTNPQSPLDLAISSKPCQNRLLSRHASESTIRHQNVDEHPEILIQNGRTRVQFFEGKASPIPDAASMTSMAQGNKVSILFRASTHMMATETAQMLVDTLVKIHKDIAK